MLITEGYDVCNPSVPNPTFDKMPKEKAWAEYMKRDIAWLSDCDAIYMLPGWRESRGACIEYVEVVKRNMVVLNK